MGKLNHILNLLLIVLFIFTTISCKLFQEKDTTDPIVNLTIEGGNEISREVTIYLNIEDDSKIDYVDIIIDDSTAVTITSNFDTIRFDVTPFSDESEHLLYAKVVDSEGNIGESEKLDIVITEFPGWRKYNYIDESKYVITMKIDENYIIWIGTNDGLFVYDIYSNTYSEINPLNGELPNPYSVPNLYIEDINVIDGSRVWIATNNHITEYHYGLNQIIKSIEIPPLDGEYHFSVFSIAINNNYDVWIGGYGGIRFFDHSGFDLEFSWPDYNVYRPFEMIVDENNTLYICDEGGLFKIENNIYSRISYYGGQYMVRDSYGNIWLSGLYMWDGNTLHRSKPPVGDAYPLLIDKNGCLYTKVTKNYPVVNMYSDYQDLGLVTYKDSEWTFWNELDSPFANPIRKNDHYFWRNQIVEAPNGDIWMVLDNELWRYRPSLGGYP